MKQSQKVLYQISAARRLFDRSKYWTDKNGITHLIWQGAIAGQGYGYFSYYSKTCRVHRVVWEIVNGPIPNDLHVLHKCDIRTCIDISHLFLGSDNDNKEDMVSKDREPGRNNLTGMFVPNSLTKISSIFKDK